MARIRLITRGDDAGSCESADLALVEAANAGVLRNIGVIVPGPTFEHAASLLRGLKGVAIGLHVTLNSEWDTVKWGPVLPPEDVLSLVDEAGHFTASPEQLRERGFSKDEAIAEVRAQLDKARKAGLEIRYLDEHMGVSWIGFREELAELCEQEGLVDHAGFAYLGGASSADELLRIAGGATPGTYAFVTHPGYDAEDMQAFVHPGLKPGQVAKERDADRRLWLDPALRDQDLFKPIRYDEA